MHSEGYGSRRVSVCFSVCVSVKSHVTSGASVCRENAATHSAGNEGQKICGVLSETVPLQRSSTPSHDGHISGQPFFLQETRMSIVHMQVFNKNRSQCAAPYTIAVSSPCFLTL